MVAGVPSGTLEPMFKTLFRYPRCPRAMPTGRWLRSEAHFFRTFKLRASRAPLFCATQASCFWSLACCPEREGVRSRAAKSPVAPGAGRNVSGGAELKFRSPGGRPTLVEAPAAPSPRPAVPGTGSRLDLRGPLTAPKPLGCTPAQIATAKKTLGRSALSASCGAAAPTQCDRHLTSAQRGAAWREFAVGFLRVTCEFH